MVPATESHDISFRQVHTADGGRIRNRKICELDGQQLLPGPDPRLRRYEAGLTLILVADSGGLPLRSGALAHSVGSWPMSRSSRLAGALSPKMSW
ncbi:hypothetical protein [Streptomyces sp. NBC_01214]|uniref:hypothetical protein n=1 Tax=Streptomyces sp. NBC_01214 TaxID=2903777 RepID=UPI002B1E09DA|nr:hypothetical protein [Streptomyces sp. NBC_01214]